MGRIENKPSKDKSSYFLSDNNITDSEPHIPTIMATPLVETSSFNAFYPVVLKNKLIISFRVNTKNDKNNSLETL